MRVCVMIFQKQLQHIANMSMITKEKYLLNSFPAFDRFLCFYCYMVGGVITHLLKEYRISVSKHGEEVETSDCISRQMHM